MECPQVRIWKQSALLVLRLERQDLMEPEFLVSSQVLSSAPSRIPVAQNRKSKKKKKNLLKTKNKTKQQNPSQAKAKPPPTSSFLKESPRPPQSSRTLRQLRGRTAVRDPGAGPAPSGATGLARAAGRGPGRDPPAARFPGALRKGASASLPGPGS